MLTIVFYSTDGKAAKQRAREISATSKSDYARCYDVSVWGGTPDKCDSVEIMKDVPGWQRKRITDVYGEVEEYIAPEGDSIEVAQEVSSAIKSMGLMPAKESDKKAVHRGGGRWFVMSGDTVLSGPHDKTEAAKLAAEEDIAAA